MRLVFKRQDLYASLNTIFRAPFSCLLVSCVALPIALALFDVARADHDLPNIVIVYADDLGFGDLSCYNDKAPYKTPRLDQMAAEGIRFTDAHSPSTICSPSRYGLFSGQQIFRSTGRGGGGAEWPKLLETWHTYDMLPVMLGERDEADSIRPHLLTQSFRGEFQIRQGHWKYLDHKGPGGNDYAKGNMAQYALAEKEPDALGQLYDLKSDPGETTNLYFKEEAKRKELQQLLAELKSSGRSAPTGRKPFRASK